MIPRNLSPDFVGFSDVCEPFFIFLVILEESR